MSESGNIKCQLEQSGWSESDTSRKGKKLRRGGNGPGW